MILTNFKTFIKNTHTYTVTAKAKEKKSQLATNRLCCTNFKWVNTTLVIIKKGLELR